MNFKPAPLLEPHPALFAEKLREPHEYAMKGGWGQRGHGWPGKNAFPHGVVVRGSRDFPQDEISSLVTYSSPEAKKRTERIL